MNRKIDSQKPLKKTAPSQAIHPEGTPKPSANRKRSWMAELLFEHSFGEPAPLPTSGAEPGVMSAYPGYSQEQLLGGQGAQGVQGVQSGFVGSRLPRSFEEYRDLLARTYDPMKRDLALKILEQPALRMALSMWDGRQLTNQHNKNLANEIIRFVSLLMGKVYDFNPAGVIIRDLPSGLLGQQDSQANRVYLSPVLLRGRAREFLDTIVHEQIHRLQAELMFRLNLSKKGKVLTPEERALAMYWKMEEPKYRSVTANGWELKGDAMKRYRELGQEYHAFETANWVAATVCPFDPSLPEP